MTIRIGVGLVMTCAALAVTSGCSGGSSKTTGALPKANPDGATDQMSLFVVDLVTKQTLETNRPVRIDETLPDTESTKPYDVLFR